MHSCMPCVVLCVCIAVSCSFAESDDDDGNAICQYMHILDPTSADLQRDEAELSPNL